LEFRGHENFVEETSSVICTPTSKIVITIADSLGVGEQDKVITSDPIDGIS
jgi:hypothetical protein